MIGSADAFSQRAIETIAPTITKTQTSPFIPAQIFIEAVKAREPH